MDPVYNYPPGHGKWRSLLASFTFLRNPVKAISKNMKKFSGTYSAHLMGLGKLIITEDPDFIQYVLRDNHANYQKSTISTKTAARLFGNGLLFSNGKPWLKQRRLIQPAFHHAKIKGLNAIVVETASDFLDKIPTGDRMDIYPLMHRLSFAVLIHSLFDINLSAGTVAELSQGFTDLQDFLLKDINQPFRKVLYPLNKAEDAILMKSKNIRRILTEIIEQRKAVQSVHHDLLDMLLNTRYEDTGEAMDPEQMIDEILVLLFAGHETTANSLSWILFLLATHPEISEKLLVSIRQTQIFDIPKDPYMNAVLSEGMRLYPAAWMTERVALSDDVFNGYSFEKGTIIIPFFYGLHRNKKYWDHESDFNPDRFLFTDEPAQRKTKNFFPFGAGPRMCIGNNFAMAEMSFILYLFLESFQISPHGEQPDMWPLITLRPKRILLNITRREDQHSGG